MIDDDSPKKKKEQRNVPPYHTQKKDSDAKFVNEKEAHIVLHNKKLRDVLHKELRRPGRSE